MPPVCGPKARRPCLGQLLWRDDRGLRRYKSRHEQVIELLSAMQGRDGGEGVEYRKEQDGPAALEASGADGVQRDQVEV